jgi:2-polyprenyl-3-methyl-5-hydroxy-6-metoxy-1,4-benzoquinol methylase
MTTSFIRRMFGGRITSSSADRITPTSPLVTPVTLIAETAREALAARYNRFAVPELSYATVRDFCDGVDALGVLCSHNGDLKDAQRPWMVKAALAKVPPGGTVIEIGGGIPLVAGALADFGYRVTLVDPYDGGGNGPVEHERYVRQFPNVSIIKDYFGPELRAFAPASVDAIISVSVLEHVPLDQLAGLFGHIRTLLRPGGHSIHCVDSVIAGNDTAAHTQQLVAVLGEQRHLADRNAPPDDRQYERLIRQLTDDLETFYLSGHGHNLWRGEQPYDAFPFRRVVSIQSCVAVLDDRR